jgi:hypothetical protein
MHAWFRGIAEQLAAEKDVRQIMVLGEEGIDEVFAELADAAAAATSPDDDDAELTPKKKRKWKPRRESNDLQFGASASMPRR